MLAVRKIARGPAIFWLLPKPILRPADGVSIVAGLDEICVKTAAPSIQNETVGLLHIF
jgi:hypothetical protein